MVTATPAAARPRRVSAVVAPVERSIGTLAEIPLELIDVGPNIRVDLGELEDLAQSIRELGVLQPIRAIGPNAAGRYRAVWGQRRILASRLAEQATIPALVEPSADVDQEGPRRAIEQLVENIQRADLGPIDEAYALQRVLDADKTVTQADLARRLGRSASWLANTLGLLDSPKQIQDAIAGGQLTASHAKALKGLAPATQVELGTRAVKDGASAHDLEERVRWHKQGEANRVESEKRSRIEAAAKREARTRKIAALEKKIPKTSPIHVLSYGHGESAEAIAKLFTTAGYTNVSVATSDRLNDRPKDVGCDCTDWQAQVGWDGGFSIRAVCSSSKHQAAKTKADDAARRATAELEQLGKERIREALPELIREQPLGRTPARLALWVFHGYRIDEWAKERGSKDPWAALSALTDEELVTELATAIADRFGNVWRDGAAYPWQAILDELGAGDPATEEVVMVCPFPGCDQAADHSGKHDIVADGGHE